jgi:hypothetical protein
MKLSIADEEITIMGIGMGVDANEFDIQAIDEFGCIADVTATRDELTKLIILFNNALSGIYEQ